MATFAFVVVSNPARAEVYSLERCVSIALENSQTLHATRAGYGIAEKQVREAWGGVLPTLSADASLTRNLTADKTFFPAIFFDSTAAPGEQIPVRFTADNLWSASLTLEQTLFQGDVFVGIGAAARFRAYQAEVLRGVSQDVVTTVRRAYHAALLARESQRLTGESLRRVRQSLEETRAMNRAGVATDYDVLRLEVEEANLAAELRRSGNGVDAADRQLRVVMGVDVDAPIEVEGSLREIDLAALGAADSDSGVQESGAAESPEAKLISLRGLDVAGREDLDRLVKEAKQDRSDLRQAQLNRDLASTELSAERSRLLPTLSMFASYRYSAQENGSLDFFGENESQRTSNWQAGLRLSIPIFEGGKKWSRVSQKRLNLVRRQAEQGLAEERAVDDVENRLDALLEARDRARAQSRAVQQAQRGFEIASAEYRAGVGTRLQLTDAEVALRQTQFNYAEAVFDVLEGQALLDKAVGVVPSVDDVESTR